MRSNLPACSAPDNIGLAAAWALEYGGRASVRYLDLAACADNIFHAALDFETL
jgi:hypothetical protein